MNRVKSLFVIVVLAISIFIVYNNFFKVNDEKNILNEQLNYVNINKVPHYNLGESIEIDNERFMYNGLRKEGNKLIVETSLFNIDVRLKLLDQEYTLYLGNNDEAILMDNYVYLNNEAYFVINDTNIIYNQIIVQNDYDANSIYVIELEK